MTVGGRQGDSRSFALSPTALLDRRRYWTIRHARGVGAGKYETSHVTENRSGDATDDHDEADQVTLPGLGVANASLIAGPEP
jgi:hypothetical protein